MKLKRASGILLHPTSLPGGRLGEDAYRFVDWLAAAGQSWWQVLPLGPPDDAGSPYNARRPSPASPGAARRAARTRLRRRRGVRRAAPVLGRRLGRVRRRGRARRPGALRAGVERAARLRAQARRPHHRRRPDLRRRRKRRPPRASGALRAGRGRRRAARRCRASASTGATRSTTGPRTARRGYRWWIERFRRTFELVDVARIDHFRGFVAYWAVPGGTQDRAARTLASRPRAPSCSGPSKPSSATCR